MRANDDESCNFTYTHKIIANGTMMSIDITIPGPAFLANAKKIVERIRPAPGFRKPAKPTGEVMEAARRDLVQRCSDAAITRSLAHHQADVAEKTDPSVIDLLVHPDGSLSYTILVSVVPLPFPDGTVNVEIEPAAPATPVVADNS